SNHLYHPGSAEEFRLVADALEVTADGAVRMKGFVRDGGYRVLTSGVAVIRDLLQKKTPEKDPVLLTVPRELRSALSEILYITGAGEARSDQECFAKLLQFFREHFQYDLHFHRRWGEDPVLTFLLHSRRGHCELYASALTLLLRQKGIPARYVTGFICEEPDLFRHSFLARQNNAHAWTEAYDRDQKCWVQLEPTPEVELPRRRFETFYQCLDALILAGKEILASLHRGLYARAIYSLLEFLWRIMLVLVRSPFFWLAAVLGTWGYFRWRKRSLRRKGLWGPDKDRRKLIRQYRRRVRSLRRRLGLPRHAMPGAAELAEAVRASALDPAEKERHLAWLRKYRRKRFRCRMPENDGSGN
ncbi:MAG: transglutaminase domain-containing protein, partial [Lentisphaeria bacterium]|nr:transglutaminase domain-containing protein [Lentisphaeria bacterium]